jgi:hypothetical protein
MDLFYRVAIPKLAWDHDKRKPGDVHHEEEHVTEDDETMPAGWWVYTGLQYIDAGPFPTEEEARQESPRILEMAKELSNG